MNKVLEVRNLTKRFDTPSGEITAVDNISFSLSDGEILGLLGPNGAGKTTTIHLLLGVTTPSKGEIKYFDKSFDKSREEILKKVNFSSGYISLPWLLTVDEILDVFARLYEIPNKKERITRLLSIFEIEDSRKKQFYKLSAGQKSRVFLVKAFLNYPRIILLDEPTASLDPDIAEKVREFLKKERKEFKVSMIFTSHNMPEVEEMCDRLIFINHGKIVAEGTPEKIAQGVEECRLNLIITKNQDRAVRFFHEEKLKIEQDKNHFLILAKESAIASLLTKLASRKIEYAQISIDKPNLEDFFLSMTRGKND
ncbi:MAG: ABC transporter ATP-binding protein [Patescibacteria group bacterium]